MVRVEDGSLNVAAAFEPASFGAGARRGWRRRRSFAEAGFPPIAGLEDASLARDGRPHAATRPLAQDRLFLLGDAAGYVEPFTGEGIAWALASGQAVAPLASQAMERWDPQLARAWSMPPSAADRPPPARLSRHRDRLAAALVGFDRLRGLDPRSPRRRGFVLRRLNAPSVLHECELDHARVDRRDRNRRPTPPDRTGPTPPNSPGNTRAKRRTTSVSSTPFTGGTGVETRHSVVLQASNGDTGRAAIVLRRHEPHDARPDAEV